VRGILRYVSVFFSFGYQVVYDQTHNAGVGLEIVPIDIDLAYLLSLSGVNEFVKCTVREVDRVFVLAGRASITAGERYTNSWNGSRNA
jgi:hypothetical protein